MMVDPPRTWRPRLASCAVLRNARVVPSSSFSELVSFLELLPDPHILCDTRYRILAANRAYLRVCGEDHAAEGRTCYEVSHRASVPCDQAGETCPLRAALVSGQRERVLHLHHTPQGENYINIELSPVRDAKGDIVCFVEKMEPLVVARGLTGARGLVGRSAPFQRMLELVARVAKADATVLLQGESGTGKELVAKAIHDASRRSGAPFVTVDCSGVPETLFESELFGHERGAFTGATSRRTGLVEAARGGTLFLDEVGDIPLTMQVKLLRLLETGTYRRVGTSELSHADLRVVSASHRDLRAMVAQRTFRQDLFFRLSTFPIRLPALRERRDDIALLVTSLLARVAPARSLKVSPRSMTLLNEYSYPGNVRELRNILERASLLCDGDALLPAHFPDLTGPSADEAPAQDAEYRMLRQRLAAHSGSRRALARELGISERTLYRRLRRMNRD
jgi:two-component system, NtrC family, response regulator HydG